MIGVRKGRRKKENSHFPLTPIICGFTFSLIVAIGVGGSGCSSDNSPAKTPSPIPLNLDEIELKESGPTPGFTPTAVGIGTMPPLHTPAAEFIPPTEKKTGPTPSPAKKEAPEKTAKKPDEKAPLPSKPSVPPPGTYTLQIGAYVVDENFKEAWNKVGALNLFPYVKEMKRTMKMRCVIVERGTTEKRGQEIVTALSSKGFNPKLLKGNGGLFDASAGIYYYLDDAKKAAEKVEELGYRAQVEDREVEVILKGLRVGAYKSVDEAQENMTLLKKNGFSPVILKSDQ